MNTKKYTCLTITLLIAVTVASIASKAGRVIEDTHYLNSSSNGYEELRQLPILYDRSIQFLGDAGPAIVGSDNRWYQPIPDPTTGEWIAVPRTGSPWHKDAQFRVDRDAILAAYRAAKATAKAEIDALKADVADLKAKVAKAEADIVTLKEKVKP